MYLEIKKTHFETTYELKKKLSKYLKLNDYKNSLKLLNAFKVVLGERFIVVSTYLRKKKD